jgi:hypothetical protein
MPVIQGLGWTFDTVASTYEKLRPGYADALYQDIYQEAVTSNKMDDTLFHDFVTNNRTGDMVLNLKPNIVDHVDYLIGGSVINQSRGKAARSDLWEDLGEVEDLKAKLARR